MLISNVKLCLVYSVKTSDGMINWNRDSEISEYFGVLEFILELYFLKLIYDSKNDSFNF